MQLEVWKESKDGEKQRERRENRDTSIENWKPLDLL